MRVSSVIRVLGRSVFVSFLILGGIAESDTAAASADTVLAIGDTTPVTDSRGPSAVAGQPCLPNGCDQVSDQAEAKVETDCPVDCTLRPEDSIWVISTRRASWGCCQDPLADLSVKQRDAAGTWQVATLADLESDFQFARGTLVYVHGNRVSAHDALSRGMRLYRLVTCAQKAPPLRLIIWSWPSDQVRGQLRDVRAKAARSNHEAWRLAAVLAQLPADAPLTLVGYSFGSRIVTGTLANRGGGQIGCPSGAELTAGSSSAPVRVILLAAAVHQSWLLPHGWHSPAWQSIDELVLLNNSRDPVLRMYHLIEKRGRPLALGRAGLNCLPADQAERLSQYDVAAQVGKTHDETAYLQSPTVRHQLQRAIWANSQAYVDE